MNVKEIIPNLNEPVVYDGRTYTLTGSIIRKDSKGNLYYQAEILDKNKNSICIVRLEEIKCPE